MIKSITRSRFMRPVDPEPDPEPEPTGDDTEGK